MKNFRYLAISVMAAASLGAPAVSQTANGGIECTRQSVSDLSRSDLCTCVSITRSALTMLQRRNDFIDLLQYAEAECPAFSAVLSDVQPAAIGQRPAAPVTSGGDGGFSGGGQSSAPPDPGPDSEPETELD